MGETLLFGVLMNTPILMNFAWAMETEIHAMANFLLTTIFVNYTYD